ncbi:carbohydrate-binding family 9-like protein [Galbibacter pacificus]|uniref:Carbohydrate-binding family 9-like protein n=1 Tax=Galbibacter pacificus TaxID=2996052 RepID=A0ABT6FT65_9FLAO|nr:carbohydrate-binding family 9-like protein [Galbibacter pacificus]MDG3582425.1 carbohydrate-binding family 9-like protein [Galbibacter pacificus]MDG3586457.1 carbohydrate-binding family 9-like protein [Galbibacter pacificus]
MSSCYKKSILIVLLFVSNLLICQQSNIPEIPKAYIAPKTSEAIKIDGYANENSWITAPWTGPFIDIEGITIPKYETKIKILWNEDYLYFYAKLEEPHVWATLKQRDTVIFYNNDFEIFIDPDGDTHDYMEFEINALNTIWDLFLTKPYREGGKVLDNWDIKGIKTAVQIQGSLNNSNDDDIGWTIEIAMPWSAIEEATKKGAPENQFWRINFSRVNWDFDVVDGKYQRKKDNKGNYLPEYNWVWSPQGVINMHEPERWGYVYFSSKAIVTSQSFTIPDDEYIKWQMYAWYRKQKQYKQKHHSWITSIDQLVPNIISINGKPIKPSLEIHSQGWNLSVTSPSTGSLLIIKEDGDFITNKN